MRISTAYLAQRGINSLLEQQTRLANIQEQISTGKRIIKPSDDPSGSAQILRLNEAISITNQYQRNADNANGRLTLEESTLNDVQESLLRIRDLAIQGSNSTISTQDRQSLAVEVRQRLDGLVSLANSRDANQNYLFSGYQVTTKPFSQAADGSYVYNGDQGQSALQISSGRRLADSDSGNDVFVNIKNGNGTFQVNMKPSNTVAPGAYTTAVAQTTAATAGSATSAAVTVTDYSAANVTFAVDGNAVALTTNLTDIAGVAAEIQSDLNATAGAGVYAVAVNGTAVDITKVATGVASTAPVINTGVGTTQAEFTTPASTVNGADATTSDTAFTMSIDGAQFFTEAAAPSGTVTAAELDTALATFITGSGGAYTSSGSIAAGTLVLTRADGTGAAMTIDSNFSGTVGSFSGSLVSGLNAGDGIFNIGSIIDASAYVPENYTISYVTNASGNLAYNVVGSTSGQLIPAPPQDLVNDAPAHLDGGSIRFNGLQTGMTGTPAVGDSFTVSPSTKQDIFSTVQKLAVALEGGISGQSGLSAAFNTVNQALNEIDIAFENVSSVRAGIGSRLRAIEDQNSVNSSFILEMKSTLSSVKDLDIVSAVIELQTRTASLEAAQASYSRIQGLSLFNYL